MLSEELPLTIDGELGIEPFDKLIVVGSNLDILKTYIITCLEVWETWRDIA